ncbi:MAG: hypothetical protein HY000_15700 [Planctomycetes bacterium]|nr:hypothetical protein [Planctomycetota bacterium]
MEQALVAIQGANPDFLPVSLECSAHEGKVKLFCRLPPELRAAVEGQLFAQYPDCRIERLAADPLDLPEDYVSWSVEPRLRPDIFPIQQRSLLSGASVAKIAIIGSAVTRLRASSNCGYCRRLFTFQS